ncbi:MAG: CNNM domain-containing protein [Bacteroidaceae bacterium]|nr:CNNM domain-containing protein [Prevotellaceae bacterium]MDY2849700.1 CNNM domain-containing protein [Bacteroidaceae bacterium]
MGLLLLYFFIALSVSALCSVLEAVFLSTPATFVASAGDKNLRSAALLKSLKKQPNRPISAILTLNTIANTMGAAGVGAQAGVVFGSEWIGLFSGVLTLCILVFSEIIPKTVGNRYWRKLALPSANIIRVMLFVTYPLVILAEGLTRFLGKTKSQSVSRDEVSAMVKVGADEGVFEKEENKMIQHLIKLSAVTAHEIMTPSVVVAEANEALTVKEFYAREEFNTYSRIPVYKDDEEYITGYVLRQTILERLAEDKFSTTLREIVRPVLTFQEETSVSNILELMLAKKEHISIIIDEYGCMRGIVTMEDVIETMLGFEIMDERDTVTDMQDLARKKWEQARSAIVRKH